jgi:putative peptidoglycan lipid II flippase
MKLIARSTLIIAVFFGIDKVLGFVRQLLIARQFGLTYDIDVFNAANNIPDLLSALISGGALGVALIPVLSEYLQKRGRPAAWEVFSRTLNLAFVVTGLISIAIIIFARPLVQHVIAPGFPPEQQSLTIRLMRLDLAAILIFSISGLVMAGLQANQHFLLPAMAPGLYNIGQIFGVLILAPEPGLQFGPITLPGFGLGIYGLVYGVILGALMHLGIQIPGLIHYKYRWKPVIGLHDPGLLQVLNLLGPRVATMFFLQVFFIARDNLASRMGEGSVTALNYGWFIMQVPETLIGSALAIAMLPTLSEIFSRGEKQVYLLGLMGHSLLETAARSFYAQQDAKTPLYLAAANAVIYIIVAIRLASWLGAPGIALANSIAFTTEALLLLLLLRRRYPQVLAVGRTLLRAITGALLAGALALFVLQIPVHPLFVSLASMAAGGLLALPFIWPEVKTLFKL